LLACGRGTPHDLTEAQLSAVVDAERPGLEHCYRSALETNPYKHDITMEAIIEIAPSGKVSKVDLQGSGGLAGMSKCIVTAIRAWHFPEAKDPTATSLPLIFRPEVKPAQPDQQAVQQALQNALSGTSK